MSRVSIVTAGVIVAYSLFYFQSHLALVPFDHRGGITI